MRTTRSTSHVVKTSVTTLLAATSTQWLTVTPTPSVVTSTSTVNSKVPVTTTIVTGRTAFKNTTSTIPAGPWIKRAGVIATPSYFSDMSRPTISSLCKCLWTAGPPKQVVQGTTTLVKTTTSTRLRSRQTTLPIQTVMLRKTMASPATTTMRKLSFVTTKFSTLFKSDPLATSKSISFYSAKSVASVSSVSVASRSAASVASISSDSARSVASVASQSAYSVSTASAASVASQSALSASNASRASASAASVASQSAYSVSTASAASVSAASAASVSAASARSVSVASANSASVASVSSASVASASRASASSAAAASASATPSTYSYSGCYSDGNPRTLENALSVPGGSANMSVTACQAAAQAANYQYFGVEYGQECWAANWYNGGTLKTVNTCTTPCKGNTAQTCGGGNSLSFYTANNWKPSTFTNPGNADGSFQGCYTDNVGGRTLSVGRAVTGDLTVAKCLAACKAASTSYLYAGVEYANECYCGASINVNATVASPAANPPQAGCSMACKGNSTEYCGGSSRINVYKLVYP